MDPIELANRYFGQYKVHSEEIIPEYCPFCHGGPKHEKWKFALNKEKLTYNCKRLNECGAKGSFHQLCEHFGETADRRDDFRYTPKPKTYKKPQIEVEPVQSRVEEYLVRRGFSRKTWERRGVSEYKGAVAMPYYENGELVLIKYRTTEKPAKHWREPDGKPVFWGMDLCRADKPLVIVEGEMDALALDEAGVPNVVSVPSGASDLTCVELCWDWLEKFKKVIIWGDNDAAGREMAQKLILKLGQWRCAVVESPHKDANIHLFKEGKESCRQVIALAREVPVAGIKKVSEVKRLDYSQVKTVLSSIQGINKVLGGYRMGELTVWTGINSSGKSTFLGQEIVEAIDQNYPCFVYSGELSQIMFKEWIHLQMAGPHNLETHYDRIREKEVGRVSLEIAAKMEKWYDNLFYMYDSLTVDESAKLINLCEIAARRYDCKVFLIDNLMTTGFDGGNTDNLYQAQSEFVRKMVNFAKKFEVHVHLVAHPRKTSGKLTKMDVAGSGDITNRADNVVAIHRFSPKDKAEEDYQSRYSGCDALAQIFKNRFFGMQDTEVGLQFDEQSKRYSVPEGFPNKKYGWEEPDPPYGHVVNESCPWDKEEI